MQTRMKQKERRVQIIDSALKIIHEEGLFNLTTRGIAAESGITEPAIYRHFKNKDDIIAGVLSRMSELIEIIKSEMIKYGSSSERLLVFLRLHFSYLSQNPEMVTLLLSEEYFLKHEELNKKFYSVIHERYNVLSTILGKDPDNPILTRFRDRLEIAISLIIGSVRLLIMKWRNCSFSFDLISEGEKLIEVICELYNLEYKAKL